ncbi:MAG: CDP-alcohol phosphatidyltransferase family protein [Candidatus Eiseniibacteriota bacterium]|nr:MAG: CDP-alcohol phosphatidyltransferase family protein [Candidatus Eisenbacteria bacterium]
MNSLLKEKGKILVVPLARGLMRLGATAETLTLLGLLTAAGAGALFALGHLRLAAIAVLVSGILDSADGTVARLAGRVSRAGAFIDSAVDRYCEAVIFLGLLVHYLRSESHSLALLVFVAMSGAFLVSYMRARLEGLGRECRVGLLERQDRVIVLAVGGVVGEIGLNIALWLIAILSHLTALQRIRFAMKVLKDPDPERLSGSEDKPGVGEAE